MHRRLVVSWLGVGFAFGGLTGPASAQRAISSLVAVYEDSAVATNDYTTTGAPDSGTFPTDTTYRVSFNQGSDNNLRVDGFVSDGMTYRRGQLADSINIARVDNSIVTGNYHIILFEDDGTISGSNTNINIRSSYVATSQESLLSPYCNRGVDNTFVNAANGNGNEKNIERVDFVFGDGVPVFSHPTDMGLLVLERNGNDRFQIAAIRSLTNGQPASFGPSITVTNARVANGWGDSGITIDTVVMRGYTEEGRPLQPSANVGPQNICGVYFSFASLGLSTGETCYGYSLVASDSTTNSANWTALTDTNLFPLDTTESAPAYAGLDLMSGGNVFLRDGAFTIGSRVWFDSDGDGIRDAGEPPLTNVQVCLYNDDGTLRQARRQLGTFADGFDSAGGGSGGSDGTLSWGGDWVSDGADIVDEGGGDYEGQIQGGTGSYLYRNFTLPSGADRMIVTYDYSYPGNDDFVAEVSTNGGSSWITLGAYTASGSGSDTDTVSTVSGGMSGRIRFRKSNRTGGNDDFNFDNVRIRVESALSNVCTRTDAGGRYYFNFADAQLTNGVTYQIRLDLAQPAVTNYQITFRDQGSDDTRDSDAAIVPTATNFATIVYTADDTAPLNLALGQDFGFEAKPTFVLITGMRAVSRSGRTFVQWETATEFETLGFHLERETAGGWERITGTMIPALLWITGKNAYEAEDPGAERKNTYTYRLIEVDIRNLEHVYGPYALTVDGRDQSYEEWADAFFAPAERDDPAVSGRNADPDGDGLRNFEEYRAGTHPKNANSVLKIDRMAPAEGGFEIEWTSVADRSYTIETAQDIGEGAAKKDKVQWVPFAKGVEATPPRNRLVCPSNADKQPRYFRVLVE